MCACVSVCLCVYLCVFVMWFELRPVLAVQCFDTGIGLELAPMVAFVTLLHSYLPACTISPPLSGHDHLDKHNNKERHQPVFQQGLLFIELAAVIGVGKAE